MKRIPLDDAEKKENIPMEHISGNCNQCVEWRLANKSKGENRLYNKPSMFNLSKPEDRTRLDK